MSGKPNIFNMLVTLNCSQCGEEVPMENPFLQHRADCEALFESPEWDGSEKSLEAYDRIKDIPERTHDLIREAFFRHITKGHSALPGKTLAETFEHIFRHGRET